MAEKKPRIRKAETVRERNEKATLKATAEANRVRKQPIRRAGKVLSKPARVISKPFKVRPVKFVFRWIGRILLPKYFRNSYKELRQVKWPGRRESWKLTLAVLTFALVFGFFVTIVDYGLDKVIKRIIFR